jgi:uncharacterized protein
MPKFDADIKSYIGVKAMSVRIFLFLFFAYASLSLSAVETETHTHKLTVSGNATVYKPADKVSLKLGVVTNDKNVKTAISDNNKKMQRILAAIKKILPPEEFQTGTFTVEPQYTPRPKEIPPDWHAEIIGYEVRNTLSIHTTRLELAGAIIDAATREGANLVEDITFSLQDQQDAEEEAIAKAVKQAHAYADAAVKQAGIVLGDILEIAINPPNFVPRYLKAANFMLAAQGNTGTPITAGDVEVTASVSMTYRIEQH